MSLKTILLVVFIILCGIFIFLKLQVLGSPNNHFNKTTRFNLGKYPIVRTILGLHNDGDARKELFMGKGPIFVKWFKPQLEEIDKPTLEKFGRLIEKYTGRETKVVFTGNIDDVTLNKDTGLESNKIFEISPGATSLYVFFTQDYKPRGEQELASTLKENGIIISLGSHRNFLQAYPDKLNDYLLSSLLHELGHQMGLAHLEDPACIMNAHAGEGGEPMEVFSLYSPQDFCRDEQEMIQQMRFNLQNN